MASLRSRLRRRPSLSSCSLPLLVLAVPERLFFPARRGLMPGFACVTDQGLASRPTDDRRAVIVRLVSTESAGPSAYATSAASAASPPSASGPATRDMTTPSTLWWRGPLDLRVARPIPHSWPPLRPLHWWASSTLAPFLPFFWPGNDGQCELQVEGAMMVTEPPVKPGGTAP